MGFCKRCIGGTCCSIAIAVLCILLSPLLKKPGHGELVLAHIPYNFGHTVETNSLLGHDWSYSTLGRLRVAAAYVVSKSIFGGSIPLPSAVKSWVLRTVAMDGAEFYGVFVSGLDATSEVSGCPLYLTPQKHWPADIAKDYFGNRKVFGILRDPYERLVAQFRGNFKGYGADDGGKLRESCDVNTGVKRLLKMFKELNNPFAMGCTLLPQAEYFDPPYSITVPINNRKFPDSMNAVFKEHGYAPSHQIQYNEILHVSGCNEKWSDDLDNETRGMVRELFARDFELLCKHFGYCDNDERACLPLVPEMCPTSRTQCRDKNGKPAATHWKANMTGRDDAFCNPAWEPGSSGPPAE